MLNFLFSWPDECESIPVENQVQLASKYFRLQDFLHSESLLLAYLAIHKSDTQALFLLCMLRLRISSFNSFLKLSSNLDIADARQPFLFAFLQAQYLLQIGSVSTFKLIKFNWSFEQEFWPLYLSHAALSLHVSDYKHFISCLDSIPDKWQHCLEVVRLRARYFEHTKQFSNAISTLAAASTRFPKHIPLRIQLLDIVVKAHSQDKTLPVLNQLLSDFGEIPELYTLYSQILLLQNKNADARRVVLKNRVANSIVCNSESLSSNIYNCYDRLGLVDWLSYTPFLENSVCSSSSSLSLAVRENLCMQAASLELPQYSFAVSSVISEYQSNTESSLAKFQFSGPAAYPDSVSPQRLNIAWLTADVSYHPVGRFLFGILNSLKKPIHNHIVVDTLDHGQESRRDWFESLPAIKFLSLDQGSLISRVSRVRSLNADISIDLSGWTSGHFMQGFLCKLSPIQISYLGYFASTGLPSMNYWLGDSSLFPVPNTEWHTEQFWRLPRCFLAWDPPSTLPEAMVDVPSANNSCGSDIRFGSFNNHRKLSDRTLIAWGRILNSVPGSSLVLKAGISEDKATSSLLASRMSRAGLDPARVIWIPRTGGICEHLQQYSYVDVSLDPFPNGGCTTTCESLWMGVPVVTLTGMSYVSRMSTAVLNGAELSNWCTTSLAQYCDLAISQADNVSSLRNYRDTWRSRVTSTQLGDSESLFSSLEEAFTQMVLDSR